MRQVRAHRDMHVPRSDRDTRPGLDDVDVAEGEPDVDPALAWSRFSYKKLRPDKTSNDRDGERLDVARAKPGGPSLFESLASTGHDGPDFQRRSPA